MRRNQGRPTGQKSAETRKSIALAYIQICYLQGPEWVNLKTIADKAGYTLAAIRYQYPKGIAEIRSLAFEIVSLGGKAFTDEQMSLMPSESPLGLLSHYIHVTFDWFRTHPEFAAFWVYAFFETVRSGQNHNLPRQKQHEVQKAHRRIFDILLVFYPQSSDQGLDSLEESAIELHALLVGFILSAICDKRVGAIDTWRKRAIVAVSSRLNQVV